MFIEKAVQINFIVILTRPIYHTNGELNYNYTTEVVFATPKNKKDKGNLDQAYRYGGVKPINRNPIPFHKHMAHEFQLQILSNKLH